MAFDPVTDKFGMIALNGATEVSVNLDPRYQYIFKHTGIDASGNDDAQSTLSAWISTISGTITANKSVEDEKYEILDGSAFGFISDTFGPGISKLYIVSTTGADAVLKFTRVGTPTNSY